MSKLQTFKDFFRIIKMKEKRYRESVEIIRDILSLSRKGEIQNRIIYHANLSTKLFKKYSTALEECGYVEKRNVSNNVVFRTTSEGLTALETLDGTVSIVKEVKKRMK
jgi:predicted transcriptional regulator